MCFSLCGRLFLLFQSKNKTKVYSVTLREFQLFCSREDFGAFIHFCVNVSHSTKQIWGTASVLKLLLTETHSKRDLFTVAVQIPILVFTEIFAFKFERFIHDCSERGKVLTVLYLSHLADPVLLSR